jgi:hypothetical protein
MVPCDVVASITLPCPITNSAFELSGTDAHEQSSNAMSRWRIFFISLQNAQTEPRSWLARIVLLGAQSVTAMIVGSSALLGSALF